VGTRGSEGEGERAKETKRERERERARKGERCILTGWRCVRVFSATPGTKRA
jgi:hypothetical protein